MQGFREGFLNTGTSDPTREPLRLVCDQNIKRGHEPAAECEWRKPAGEEKARSSKVFGFDFA